MYVAVKMTTVIVALVCTTFGVIVRIDTLLEMASLYIVSTHDTIIGKMGITNRIQMTVDDTIQNVSDSLT